MIKTPVIGQLFMKYLKSMVARNWYRVALGECHKDQYRAYLDPVIMAFKDGAQFRLADAYQQVLQLDGSALEVPHDAIVIWGEDDRTHIGSDKKSVLRHVPHAQYVTFSGCGHFPSLEKMHDYLTLVQH
jgi:pimeloyl-ACP methyl ester carboxylesterase